MLVLVADGGWTQQCKSFEVGFCIKSSHPIFQISTKDTKEMLPAHAPFFFSKALFKAAQKLYYYVFLY